MVRAEPEQGGREEALLRLAVALCKQLGIGWFADLRDAVLWLFMVVEELTTEQRADYLRDRWFLRQPCESPAAA